MPTENIPPSPGLGLTVKWFLSSLPDSALKSLLSTNIVKLLDAIFSGTLDGENLRRVACNLVEFDSILEQESGRKFVLSHLPNPKLLELGSRFGVDQITRNDYAKISASELRDFFGLEEERLPSIKELAHDRILPNYGLFDHQRTAVRRLAALLANEGRRAILHLPTGIGKTRTAMHLVAHTLRNQEPSVVVWLASGKELLQQAVESFKEAWENLGTRSLEIGSLWEDSVLDIDAFSDGFLAVGLSKGWSLSRADPDWALRLSKRVRLVVFDEAHQSIAKTYKRITEQLTLDYRCALLGLTATPGRTWTDIDADGKLADFFAGNKVTIEVPSNNPIEYLISNGYLAKPTFRTLLSQPGLQLDGREQSRISKGLDIPEDIIESLSMKEQYVTAVLEAIDTLLHQEHKRVLVFAASVEQAKTLNAVMLARGVQGYAIFGQTGARARDKYIAHFKSDDEIPLVLVNFGVLTTGFDAPKASAVVIARPTRSLVLFSQMVGRAIRGPKAGGTETCDVITVVDPNLPGFGDVAEAFLNWEDVW